MYNWHAYYYSYPQARSHFPIVQVNYYDNVNHIIVEYILLIVLRTIFELMQFSFKFCKISENNYNHPIRRNQTWNSGQFLYFFFTLQAYKITNGGFFFFNQKTKNVCSCFWVISFSWPRGGRMKTLQSRANWALEWKRVQKLKRNKSCGGLRHRTRTCREWGLVALGICEGVKR